MTKTKISLDIDKKDYTELIRLSRELDLTISQILRSGMRTKFIEYKKSMK